MYKKGLNADTLARLMAGVAAIGVVAFSSTAQSQNAIQLPGITVEASSLDGEGVDADKVGSSVSVITGKQIEQMQAQSAADVLRNVAGVNVGQSNGLTGQTQVRIRGAEGNHTLVIVDGVVVNTASEGEFDFSNLSAAEIERIEVLRGPQSGIYGSNALGGVIKITTKKGRGPLRATIQAEAGSFNTKAGKINISGGSEKVFGSFTVDHIKTDGFDISSDGLEDDGGRRRSIFFNGGIRPLDNLTINFMLRDVHKTGDRDDDADFNGIQNSRASFFSTDMFLIGTSAKLETFGGKWIHQLNANKQETHIFDYSEPYNSQFNNESESLKLSYLTTYKFDTSGIAKANHALTGLIEYTDESYIQHDGTDEGRTRDSYALQYRGDFTGGVSLGASVRQDNNDAFDDYTTYNVNASWKIPGSGFRLHSNVGTGVVFPGLFEQFGSFASFTENPNLIPEESFGWDAGIEWKSADQAFKVDVTYFNQDLENEIAFNSSFALGDPTLINLDGKSERQGIEVQLTSKITENLLLTGAYTYLDATDGNGDEEIRRAPHSAKLNLNYQFASKKGNLNLGVNYNGRTKDFDFANFSRATVTLDDYVLVSLAGSYKVQPNVELFGRVENLLDADYQEVYGFETAGVSAYAGIKVKLGPVDEK